jgi:hypothetical protein
LAVIKTRLKEGSFVNRVLISDNTYSLQLPVEGVGSLEEAIEKMFEAGIREVDDNDEVGCLID